jgi:hypothetical protein
MSAISALDRLPPVIGNAPDDETRLTARYAALRIMRTLAAMAIAPLAVIPALVVLFGPWALAHGGTRTLTGIVVPAMAVAYPMVALFGLPMHLALIRAGCTRRRDYAIAGVLLGAVPVAGYVMVAVAFEAKFAIAAMGPAFVRNAEWGAIGVVVFGLCSAAVAIAFRAIAIRRHPLTT